MIVLGFFLIVGGACLGWGLCSYHSHNRGKVAQLVALIEQLEGKKGHTFTATTVDQRFPFSHSGP